MKSFNCGNFVSAFIFCLLTSMVLLAIASMSVYVTGSIVLGCLLMVLSLSMAVVIAYAGENTNE